MKYDLPRKRVKIATVDMLIQFGDDLFEMDEHGGLDPDSTIWKWLKRHHPKLTEDERSEVFDLAVSLLSKR